MRSHIGTTPQNRSYDVRMSQLERVFDRLRALDERLARLRAEKIRITARASQSERRRDTRRKILIGGAVLAAIEHEGVPALRAKAELLRWLDVQLTRPHDRAVFDLAVPGASAKNETRSRASSSRSVRLQPDHEE